MSARCTIWAWAQASQMPDARVLLVLLSVADQANDDTFECFPSQEYISDRTHICRNTVGRALIWLENNSFIGRRNRSTKDGGRISDVITVKVTQTVIFPDQPKPKKRDPKPKHGEAQSPAVVQKPSTEPDKNRSSLRSESAPVADLQLDGGSAAIDAQAYPPDAFEQWYRIYPRKAGRDQARKTFAKVVKEKRVGFADLMKATAEFKEIVSLRGDKDVHFTPHPSTWLNAGSWADDLDFERRAADAHARTPTERRGLETAHNLGGLYAASQAAVLAKQVQRGRDPGDTE